MQDRVKIGRALLSLCRTRPGWWAGACAFRHGVELISTGGTARALREAGLQVKDISEVTDFPDMMDGAGEDASPKVHGGLSRCATTPSMRRDGRHGIGAIDLLVVNLYPFASDRRPRCRPRQVIENIDMAVLRWSARPPKTIDSWPYASTPATILKLSSVGRE